MPRLAGQCAVIAVYGPPGVGKTTLGKALAEQMGRGYVSSGDLARKADPEALARGEMADRDRLRAAFQDAMREAIDKYPGVIVDGLPRDPSDIALLPMRWEGWNGDTVFILLTADPDTSIQRQLRRAREGDEPLIIGRRTSKQRRLMAIDDPDGWARQMAHKVIDTSMDPDPGVTLRTVLESLPVR